MPVLDPTAAKAYLHINQTLSAEDEALLASTIAAAEAAIAQKVGPLEAVPTVAQVATTGGALILDPPIAELVSITDATGTPIAPTSVIPDADAGLLTRAGGFTGGPFTVTYNRGRSECPADLLEAVKVLVKHLWAAHRGTGARGGASASDGAANTIPGAGYLLPNRVLELLEPHMQIGFS